MASNGIQYEIFIDAAAVESAFTRLAADLPRYRLMWLTESAALVKETMALNAPEGVAGAAGQGLKHNIGVTMTEDGAEIKPNSNVSSYADAVETGSRPHRPPVGPDSALAQWCEMKGLSVWAVAKTIERNGTRPHPYIEPTYQATKEPVTRRFSDGVTQYLEGMVAL